MPQPIMKKYKQGEFGMPYPKVKDKKNMNLSAHGGEADVDIATLKTAKSKVQFKKGMERLGKTKTPNMILRERGVVEKVLDFLLERDKDLYKGKSLDEQMKALKVG